MQRADPSSRQTFTCLLASEESPLRRCRGASHSKNGRSVGKTWLLTSLLGHTNGGCLHVLQLGPDRRVDADLQRACFRDSCTAQWLECNGESKRVSCCPLSARESVQTTRGHDHRPLLSAPQPKMDGGSGQGKLCGRSNGWGIRSSGGIDTGLPATCAAHLSRVAP